MVVPDVITSQIIASSSTHDHAPAFAFVKSFKSILSSLRTSLRTSPHTDNIGSVDYTDRLSYPPIDAVYTWVNGSDPVWLSSKSAFAPPPPASVMVHNDTALKNGTANATAAQTSDSASNNRYRDSNELKYSLRSLEKHAPWLRHIYVVTDNQIPSWLDLSNPKLTIVPHTSIFPNASHLPVFSSPAIESHLHLIPSLSRYFLYFNDDVFLGSPTFPDDFLLPSSRQKFYTSWDVPKCNPGCSDTWLGDGYCDKACNVSACNFDHPDCLNKTKGEKGGRGGRGGGKRGKKSAKSMCAKGCPDTWVGDKVCDNRCNKVECAYDAGDCGIERLYGEVEGGRAEGGMVGGGGG
ncbi:hypothetical protein TrRE_jg13218, partial [Triparma retinervis]